MSAARSLVGFEFPIGTRTYRVVSYSSGGYVNIVSTDRKRQGRTKARALHAMRKASEDKARFGPVGECVACHGQTSPGNVVFYGPARYCESEPCTVARLRDSGLVEEAIARILNARREEVRSAIAKARGAS